MKIVNLRKVLPLVLVAAGLFLANYPLVKSMGQSLGTNDGTLVTDAEPGSVNCWTVIYRNGTGAYRACSIKVNGIDEKCIVVLDVSYHNGLSTCVPVYPPPQG